jgi:drug/metabolite transporter (DMT)-like permease
MPIEAPRLDGRSWALLVSLAALWSVSFIFIKVAAEDIPAFTLVLIRVGLAAAVLHAVVLARRIDYPRSPAIFGRFAVMGTINNIIPFALIVYATSRLGAGSASILNATAPIFALVVAHFATADEKITPAKVAGILLGVGGVAAMAGPQAVAGLTADLAAIAAMLVACFFYGLSAVYGRGFRGIDATVSATCQLSASALLLLPVALVVEQPWRVPLPGTVAIAAVVALALVSTALAYVVYYALILRAGATNTILVTLLIPVGGVVLAWALLGETLSPGEAAGMFLIGLGLAIIDGRVLALLGSALARPRPGSSP